MFSMPDGGQPAKAECPIIFDFLDEGEFFEEEQDADLQQQEIDEGMQMQQADRDSGERCCAVLCFCVLCCRL